MFARSRIVGYAARCVWKEWNVNISVRVLEKFVLRMCGFNGG